MNEIRTFEAFAGYGSQLLALRRLEAANPDKIKVVPVGISEIDPHAIKAYHAVHGEDIPNYGDICKIDWAQVPDFDLFTYSFPCTDISAAGQQKGLDKGSGTRSSLLWECEKAIEIKRPKFLLMENVKALVQKKFVGSFNEWQTILEGYGYANFAKVLNAKDYGVPQNRERIFLVSIRMDGLEGLAGNVQYYFPQPMPLDRRLKDVLEAEVDEKYYLSEHVVSTFNAHRERAKRNGNGFGWKPTDGSGIGFTLRAGTGRPGDNYIMEEAKIEHTVLGWTRDSKGKVVNRHPVEVANYVTASKRDNTQNYVCCAMRGRGESGNTEQRIEPRKDDPTNTITTAQKDNLVSNNNIRIRIRKLTPRECFRLMGVDDADIDKIQAAGISNSQQYKMAGNSIVVDVLYHIFRKLLTEQQREENQLTLF